MTGAKNDDGIPLLDLKAQYERIRDEILPALEQVVESQRFIMGPEVEALERETAEYCGTAHALGVSSGSDALVVALMASAGAAFRVIIEFGKFHGVTAATTPTGCLMITIRLSPEGAGMVSP